MERYYSYAIIERDGKVTKLPYDSMEKLSNGFFRAVFDVEYISFDCDYCGTIRSYNDGKMIYLDRNFNKINNEVYIMAYDFWGDVAVAFKEKLVERGCEGGVQLFDVWEMMPFTYLIFEDGSEREMGLNVGGFRSGFNINITDDHNYIMVDGTIFDKNWNELFYNSVLSFYLGGGYFQSLQIGVFDNNGNVVIDAESYVIIGRYSNGAFPAALNWHPDAAFSGWYDFCLHYDLPTIEYPYNEWTDYGHFAFNVIDFIWFDTKGEKIRDMTADEISRLQAGETVVYNP